VASFSIKLSDISGALDSGVSSRTRNSTKQVSSLLPKNTPPEHGDVFLLDDRKEIGYSLEGVPYTVHPTPKYISGEPIQKGFFVSIADATWAIENDSSTNNTSYAPDAGRVFISREGIIDKTVGVALNSAKKGEKIEVLDYGIHTWPTTFTLTGTLTTTGSVDIVINGTTYSLGSVTSGTTSLALATLIYKAFWSNPLPNVRVTLPTLSTSSHLNIPVGTLFIDSDVGLSSLSGIPTGYTLTSTTPFSVSDIGLTVYIAPATSFTKISEQFTTNRTLASSSSAPLIEIGIVVSVNSLYIDFEGDSRGASGLTQIPVTSGEYIANNGVPVAVSIGADGYLYRSDKRKASNDSMYDFGPNQTVSGYIYTFAYGSGGSANTGSITVSGSGTTGHSVVLLGQTLSVTGTTSATFASSLRTAISGNTYLSSRLNSSVLSSVVSLTMVGGAYSPLRNTPAGMIYGANAGFGASSSVPPQTSTVVQKAGTLSGFTGLTPGKPIFSDLPYPTGSSYTQNPASFSYYTDVSVPIGYALSSTQIYIEVGFSSTNSDSNPIGSITALNPTGVADYGYFKTLSATNNLNGLGTTTNPTGQVAGTYDTTSLYNVISTTYGGTLTLTAVGSGAVSGTFKINGISYTPTGTGTTAVTASILTQYNLNTQTGITVANPSGTTVTVANTSAVSPPVLDFSGLTGVTISNTPTSVLFSLPNFTQGQIRYANWYVSNPTQAPLFRHDTGWTSWGSLFSGAGSGSLATGGGYLQVPVTTFGSDLLTTDVFVEIFVQKDSVIRKIDSVPIVYNYTSGSVTYKRYGYQVSKDTEGYVKIEIANDGLAYYDSTQSAGSASQYVVINNSSWQYRIFVYKTERYNKYYDYTSDQWLSQFKSLSLVNNTASTGTQNASVGGYFDRSATAPTHSTRLNYDGTLYTYNNVVSNGQTITAGGLTVTAGGIGVTVGDITTSAGKLNINYDGLAQNRGIKVVSGNANPGGIFITSATTSSADSATVEIIGQKDDNSSVGAYSGQLALGRLQTNSAITTSGINLGRILFGGNPTGTSLSNVMYSAQVHAESESTWSSSSTMKTALVFSTGASGISSPATLSNAGSERMRIASTGQVRIGNPNSNWSGSDVGGLDVSFGGVTLVLGAEDGVSIRTDQQLKSLSVGGAPYINSQPPTSLLYSTSTGSAGSTTTNELSIGGGNSSLQAMTSLKFYTAPTGLTLTGTLRMAITSAGRVLIGATDDSTNLLQVNGSIVSWGSLLVNTAGNASTASSPYIVAKNGFSSASLPDYTFWQDTNTGIFHSALDTLGFTTNGTQVLQLSSTQQLLVGTASSGKGQVVISGSGQVNAISDAGAIGGSLILQGADNQPGSGGILAFSATGTSDYGFSALRGVRNATNANMGDLAFYTRNATGDTSLTERMRLFSTGNLGMGITAELSTTPLVTLYKATPGTLLRFLETNPGGGVSSTGLTILSASGSIVFKNFTSSTDTSNPFFTFGVGATQTLSTGIGLTVGGALTVTNSITAGTSNTNLTLSGNGTGRVATSAGLTVGNNLVVTAGGLTVTAGGLTVTGDFTVTDNRIYLNSAKTTYLYVGA
jgi:hypothetical protein